MGYPLFFCLNFPPSFIPGILARLVSIFYANPKAQFFIVKSTLKLYKNIFLFATTNSFNSLTHFQKITPRSSSIYLQSNVKVFLPYNFGSR